MFNVIPRWALVLGIGAASAAGVVAVAPAANASREPAYASFALASDQVGEVVNDVTKAALGTVGANANGVVSTVEGSINDVVSPALGQVGSAAGTVNDAVNGLLGVNLGL